MIFRSLLCAACLAAFLFPVRGRAAPATPKHARVGLIAHDNVSVYAQSSRASQVLAVLVQQTQVEVLAQHASWDHVSIWASVDGWVPRNAVVFRRPWPSISTYHAPQVHYHVHAHAPRSIRATATLTAAVQLYRSPDARPVTTKAVGAHIMVTGWRQDAAGAIWYRSGGYWMPGDAVRFSFSNPGTVTVGGIPVWSRLRGKGMWLTLGTVANSDPGVLIRAARRNGITHLYLESAISPLGFHGKDTVGHLIDAAHQSHLTVIAWVYPYLYDLAADVDLTNEVAAFRTPAGNGFDGIAADLERNVSLSTVRTYSQLVRWYLGPHYLLVGVTYPPQSFPTYPFAEVAHDYNLIAPMDYWHQTKTAFGLDYAHQPYGYNYSYRYALDSIVTIRRYAGDVPIAPIGQVFDDFGRLGMGPYTPAASEIQGFLAGSRAGGAAGASFFQWMTATDAEWHVIGAYHF